LHSHARLVRGQRGGRTGPAPRASWPREAFERPDDRFSELGIGIRVLEPGQPKAKYHSENEQEDLLMRSGECLVSSAASRP
jgi:hypothetical protein